MKRLPCLSLVLVVAVLFGGVPCPADTAAPSLPDFDQRRQSLDPPARLTPEQRAAAMRLRDRVPAGLVAVDEILGTPKWIASPFTPLSAALDSREKSRAKSDGPVSAAEAETVTREFLRENRDLFGHGPEILDTAVKTREFTSPVNGLHTVAWEQQVDGIPVHDSIFISHVTRRGELVNVSSLMLPEAERAAERGHPGRKALQARPPISAREAVNRAAENVGEAVPLEAIMLIDADESDAAKLHRFKAGGLPGEAQASLVWLPMGPARMRLCWEVQITRQHRGETYLVLVDVQTGEPLMRRCRTFDLADATYHVFTSDSPSPFSPGFSSPNTNQPPLVPRSLVTLSALSTNASPNGWIADGENETRGNNVHAHLDRYGDNLPDLPRPQGSPARVFDFPLDLEQDPYAYGEAAVVQLFYWCNWMHDQLYHLGFTEAAGNFQKDNFGRGGLGGDPVIADAQDGSGRNNANFTATRDGSAPRIQMFIFTGPTPSRDAALDAEVILHEYAHGLTDRLVGGGVGMSQLQTYGLAEGWSDFYALALLSEPTDDVDGCYPVGGYLSRLYSGLTENYYFGIRRYPVSTDMTKNPLTFKDIDPAQASNHSSVPKNPTSTSSGAEVHKQGEVWCAALWEVRANLIRKYGFEEGNRLALQLVTDGLKLSPPNPNFVQARNAILQADLVMQGGRNASELWHGFAKRGLGFSATAPESSTTTGVFESFDVPDSLRVTPAGTFLASGQTGGPFGPESQTYALLNSGSTSLNWLVSSTPPWLTVTPTSGIIPGSASNVVTLVVNALANSLPPGVYSNRVAFENQTSGQNTHVPVVLVVTDVPVLQWNFLSEIFSGNGDFDLDHSTLTFTPDFETNAYAACLTPSSGLLTDPAGGHVVPMVDDCYHLITLTDGREVSLFGRRTNAVLIGSNGDLLFNVPSELGYEFDPGLQVYTNFFHPEDYFSRLRVAPLYVDLHPGMGGTVSWLQLSNRLVVTWQDVPEYGRANSNTFQVEWFFDGTIRFSYTGVADEVGGNAATPKVGLSRGIGVPPGFIENDFSNGSSCLPPSTLLLPASVVEGGGPVEGTFLLGRLATNDLTIEFAFSGTNVYALPESLHIPAGEMSANFLLLIRDDDLVNGTRRVQISTLLPDEEFNTIQTATRTLEVYDNEIASLTVSVPSTAVEGAGLMTGRVYLDSTPDADIAVELFADQPDRVQVPPNMTIPAGQTSGQFDLWIAENSEITGPITVLVAAHVENWFDDLDAVVIKDNETTNLVLALPAQVTEAAGTRAGGGRVSLSGTLRTNLVVSLSNSDTNALTIPDKVMISSGANSATFDLAILDDELLSGTRSVEVRAEAPGFADATRIIRIFDDESPSEPTNPSPAMLSMRVPSDVTLTWDVHHSGGTNAMSFDVYFGTNLTLQGTTATNRWPVQGLKPGTTYYWQVVATLKKVLVAGPVWQFTTADLDHFLLSDVASPQRIETPFSLTVEAIDTEGRLATGFDGDARLTALVPRRTSSTIVITEVDTSAADRVEFVNVSDRDVNISGWHVELYDWSSWPAPKVAFTIPGGSISAPGDVFQLRRFLPQLVPGKYPAFYFGDPLYWNNNPSANPVAVLLRDNAGEIVDFMCAVDADPGQIQEPLPIPVEQWTNGPVAPSEDPRFTYQRQGQTDRNSASDWVIATNSVGKMNLDLAVPFVNHLPLTLTPTVLANFTGGVWSGPVTLFDTAPEVFLRVEDHLEHAGTGNPFVVYAHEDIAIQTILPPGRLTVANPFAYVLQVTNTGPSPATSVWLTNDLPDLVTIEDVDCSQGTATVLGDRVVCDLGVIEPNAGVTVSITVLPDASGMLTNRAVVTRAEPERYRQNNSSETVARVVYPLLIVYDATAVEGASGVQDFVLPVALSDPSQRVITLDYTTVDEMAQAGSDYEARSGQLEFAPGVTNVDISIPIFGDRLYESNETFLVAFSHAVNAVLAGTKATVTITNDDFQPGLSIADTSVVEGDAGTTNANFLLTLTAASERPVSVTCYAEDGTAVAGLDYRPFSQPIIFWPGETNRIVSVEVLGNALFQPHRAFTLKMAYPVGAYFVRNQATATIQDDDAWRFHHFAWNVVAPTQFLREPFLATLTAQDALNRTITDYAGSVFIRGSFSNRVHTVGAATNRWEYPFGAFYHDTRLQVIYPADQVGGRGQITGLALDVAARPGQVLSNWTIRLQHTTLSNYTQAAWETNWVTVYRADQTFASTGWMTFHFQVPFNYDGLHHLMVDFSFNNSSFSGDGFCRASLAGANRSAYFRTDSGFGDPLDWSGKTHPPPLLTNAYPNTRFLVETPADITPTVVTNFVGGVWTGLLIPGVAGSGMVLQALDAGQHFGISPPFDVVERDSDSDGIPDEWEWANKLDPLDPTDALLDPDADGLNNLQEYRAGTDPGSAASTLRFASAEFIGAGFANITFPTVLGRQYELEYTDDLENGPWLPAPLIRDGTGDLLSVIVRIPKEAGVRFFRLRVLPK